MNDAAPSSTDWSSRVRTVLGGAGPLLALAALALHVGVMVCFGGRWDKTAAITIIPIWVWSFLGLALAVAGWLMARGWLAVGAATVWLVTFLVCPDEWRGLWRQTCAQRPPMTPQRPEPAATPALRVVTFNCRSSNLASAREAAAWHPDVILLQEMRTHASGPLRSLARELWGEAGSAVFGPDTVILARGRLTPSVRSPPGSAQQFVQATLTRPDGRELEIASVHLQGHVTDLRLWNWRTWRAHAHNQRRHRLYMADVMARSLEVAGTRPCLLGGDFNSPAGDRTFQTLRPRFTDAFAAAGLGWGNTFRNDWPLLRIDQVWATADLQPVAARAIATRHSDHRLVVVDYEWR